MDPRIWNRFLLLHLAVLALCTCVPIFGHAARSPAAIPKYFCWPTVKANWEEHRLHAMNFDVWHYIRYREAIPDNPSPAMEKYIKKMNAALMYFDRVYLSASINFDRASFIDSYSHTYIRQMHRLAAYKLSPLGLIGKTRPPIPLPRYRPWAHLYAEKVTEKFGMGPIVTGPMQIKGIPSKFLPRNYPAPASLHVYPGGVGAFKAYLRLAADILFTIRESIEKHDSPEIIAQEIGRFYHVAVNARPFGNINNSLFMTQVNFLLRLIGHRGMLHGDIDHLFMRLDTHQAELMWPLVLADKVPTAKELGIDHK